MEIKTTRNEIAVPENFVRIEASKLHVDDEFLSFEPGLGWGFSKDCVYFNSKASLNQFANFKEALIADIKQNRNKDFYVPKVDPSIQKNAGTFGISERICFIPGMEPTCDHSLKFWRREANKFLPERGSKLCTVSRYRLYLATIIKNLIERGYMGERVWCYTFHDRDEFSKLCKSVAMPYTYSNKILVDDEGRFVRAGRSYPVESIFSGCSPVIDFAPCRQDEEDIVRYDATGFIILEE